MRNPRAIFPVACFILVGLCLCIGSSLSLASPSKSSRAKTIRYSFTLSNPTNELIRNVTLVVLAPVKSGANHVTSDIQANLPFELDQDALGNQTLRFVFKELEPYSQKVISVSADVTLFDAPLSFDLVDKTRFLKEEPYINVSHPKIQHRADSLAGSDDVSLSTYSWVADHIQYSGYRKDNLGALYALEQGKGDCTEYMFLYMALMRANGIPVRGVAGFTTGDDSRFLARDYHNWAEVYLDGAWYIVDPQRKRYFQHQDGYVATRILDGGNGNNDEIQRFQINDKRIRVMMN